MEIAWEFFAEHCAHQSPDRTDVCSSGARCQESCRPWLEEAAARQARDALWIDHDTYQLIEPGPGPMSRYRVSEAVDHGGIGGMINDTVKGVPARSRFMRLRDLRDGV